MQINEQKNVICKKKISTQGRFLWHGTFLKTNTKFIFSSNPHIKGIPLFLFLQSTAALTQLKI